MRLDEPCEVALLSLRVAILILILLVFLPGIFIVIYRAAIWVALILIAYVLCAAYVFNRIFLQALSLKLFRPSVDDVPRRQSKIDELVDYGV